jgi:alpha-1,2-mannosyltransferase
MSVANERANVDASLPAIHSAMNRPPFVYWVSLWFAASAHAYVALTRDFFLNDMGVRVGRDFTNMWMGGRMALSGNAAYAFDVDTFRLELLDHVGILSLQNFSYPPHAFFIDALFALPPYWAALILWNAFSALVFILAARPYLPHGFPKLLAALTPAATVCMWDGQFGLFIGALWLIVFRYCDRRPVQAGLAAAVMTIKPHLGLLVAALLATRPKALASAVIGTVVLIVASGLAFGWYSWASFLFNTTREQGEILTRADANFYFNMMPTVFPAFGRSVFSWVAQAGSAIFAVSLLWRIRHLPPMQLAFPAATATFLILPYAFNYDMTVAVLGFALILFERWGSLSTRDKVFLTLGFASPQLGFLGITLAPISLLLAYDVQCKQLLRREPMATPTQAAKTAVV